MQTLLQVLLPLLLVGCPASHGAEDEDAASVTGQAAHLRHAVVPVEPGTPVVYMVSLVGVPHEQRDSSLESNKVNPELAPQSPLTNLLLLTSRNKLHDNAGLALRDVTRKRRSPTFKGKYHGGGGGGCGNCGGGLPVVVAVPYGGGGGYPYSGGGGGYPHSGGGGYPYSGGGGYPYSGGGGKGVCNTCGGGGGYSQSYSQSSAQSSSYGWGRK